MAYPNTTNNIIGGSGATSLDSMQLWLGLAHDVFDANENKTSRIWDDGKHIDYVWQSGHIIQIDYYPTGHHYRRILTWSGDAVTNTTTTEVI